MALEPTGISSNKGDTEVSTALRLDTLVRRVGIVIADVGAAAATSANVNSISLVLTWGKSYIGVSVAEDLFY